MSELIHTPVFIAGCQRSGTSMTAGILYLHGVWVGRDEVLNRGVRKSTFENRSLKEKIFRPLMKREGGDFTAEEVMSYRNRIESLLVLQGFRGGHWMYKDSSLSQMWRFVALVFPSAIWLIVRRDTEEIIRSCLSTKYMTQHKDADGWRQYVNQRVKEFEEMKQNLPCVKEIWPSKTFSGDYAETTDILHSMNMELDGQKIKKFVNPDIWNGGK